MKMILGGGLGACAIALWVFALPTARGADHVDSPAATAEPLADLTDVYAWVGGTNNNTLRLVMAVSPNAGAIAAFSPNMQYAFHVNRGDAFPAGPFAETNIICQFYDATNIECWAGNEYVTGNPSSNSGIASTSGKLKVFAGRRNDPFFFNFTGFTKVLTDVRGFVMAGTVPADGNGDGCPDVPAEITSAVVTQLGRANPDGPPVNHFATHAVLAIAVEIDRSALGGTGDIHKVWASTHQAN